MTTYENWQQQHVTQQQQARRRRLLTLSVLDLAGVGVGSTVGEALADTTSLAVRAEDLGYHRFWVAEHHGMPAVASSAPAVLLAHLAANTRSIRLGSGGVMLPNHAPMVVAEQFGTLAALHPGRIDLGLGRAPGSDQLAAHALRRRMAGQGSDDFADQLEELQHFMNGDFPADHPYSRIRTTPAVPVPVFILGSSDYGARLAAREGLPFAFAHHFAGAGGNTDAALDLYRSLFEPSEVLDEPYPMIGVTALAADTEDEARYQSRAGALSMVLAAIRSAAGDPDAGAGRVLPLQPGRTGVDPGDGHHRGGRHRRSGRRRAWTSWSTGSGSRRC